MSIPWAFLLGQPINPLGCQLPSKPTGNAAGTQRLGPGICVELPHARNYRCPTLQGEHLQRPTTGVHLDQMSGFFCPQVTWGESLRDAWLLSRPLSKQVTQSICTTRAPLFFGFPMKDQPPRPLAFHSWGVVTLQSKNIHKGRGCGEESKTFIFMIKYPNNNFRKWLFLNSISLFLWETIVSKWIHHGPSISPFPLPAYHTTPNCCSACIFLSDPDNWESP